MYLRNHSTTFKSFIWRWNNYLLNQLKKNDVELLGDTKLKKIIQQLIKTELRCPVQCHEDELK